MYVQGVDNTALMSPSSIVFFIHQGPTAKTFTINGDNPYYGNYHDSNTAINPIKIKDSKVNSIDSKLILNNIEI